MLPGSFGYQRWKTIWLAKRPEATMSARVIPTMLRRIVLEYKWLVYVYMENQGDPRDNDSQYDISKA